ncbi:MAG: NfeD family protein [Clostridia bacterium]|jgi:membrane protein implicated in regulation of membrane protease activity|nr:NfeD family protein [Clostridia bacterium]
MWQLWLIISGLFFIAEIITVGFLVFWFGIGALFAMITSFFIDSIIIQTTVFLITSTVLLFFTKKFVKKVDAFDKVKTNAYSIIDKKGIVTKEINSKNGIGQIKVGSEIWSAKSVEPDIIISEGTEIEVKDIDGVKAVVIPLKVKITK